MRDSGMQNVACTQFLPCHPRTHPCNKTNIRTPCSMNRQLTCHLQCTSQATLATNRRAPSMPRAPACSDGIATLPSLHCPSGFAAACQQLLRSWQPRHCAMSRMAVTRDCSSTAPSTSVSCWSQKFCVLCVGRPCCCCCCCEAACHPAGVMSCKSHSTWPSLCCHSAHVMASSAGSTCASFCNIAYSVDVRMDEHPECKPARQLRQQTF